MLDVFCCRQAMQKLDTAEAELSRLRGDLQARDGGTWLARDGRDANMII